MPKKIKKCLCCKGTNLIVAYKNLKDKNHFVDGNFDIIKCKNCGLEITAPLLDEKKLSKYYPEEEYYSFKKRNKLAEIYHKLSVYYFSKKNLLLNLVMYPFKSLLYTYYVDKNSKGKKILEIGCGGGFNLKNYKAYGLKTSGLEPYGGKLNERERKLGIVRKTIREANYPKENFDYIILKEVLEHIPNQERALRKCYKWLKDNGKLIITIPSTKSLWNKIFKENWYGYDIPRHIYNYNPKSILILLKRHGFKINKIRTYDLPYMLSGSLKFYFVDRGKRDTLIESSLFNLLFTPISLIVTYLKLGSIMEIECMRLKR